MIRKLVVQTLSSVAVIGLALFSAAGSWAWLSAWVCLALIGGGSLAFGLWLSRIDPGLVAERLKSPLGGGQTVRDSAVLVPFVIGFFVAWPAFMGLDARRFAWSHVPVWGQALGAVLILATFLGCTSVFRANSFASSRVRLQPERGQTVISTGPYAVVRHPMYSYALLFMVGMPLLLGSLWGLAWLVLFIPLLAARILGEEAMLLRGLPGYRDYTARVRSRLLPGVW